MSILALALQFAPAISAQDDEEQGKGGRGRRWEQRLANLSPGASEIADRSRESDARSRSSSGPR